MEFSAKSISRHFILFISHGRTPARTSIATAGRQARNLSFWAVFNIHFVWANESGFISFSIIFFSFHKLDCVFIAPFSPQCEFKQAVKHCARFVVLGGRVECKGYGGFAVRC